MPCWGGWTSCSGQSRRRRPSSTARWRRTRCRPSQCTRGEPGGTVLRAWVGRRARVAAVALAAVPDDDEAPALRDRLAALWADEEVLAARLTTWLPDATGARAAIDVPALDVETPAAVDESRRAIRRARAATDATLQALDAWGTLLDEPDGLSQVLVESAEIVAATAIGVDSGRDGARAAGLEFDVAIVDEAGQAQLTDLVVPLSRARTVILVGDHQQLPPFVDEELLERCRQLGLRDGLARGQPVRVPLGPRAANPPHSAGLAVPHAERDRRLPRARVLRRRAAQRAGQAALCAGPAAIRGGGGGGGYVGGLDVSGGRGGVRVHESWGGAAGRGAAGAVPGRAAGWRGVWSHRALYSAGRDGAAHARHDARAPGAGLVVARQRGDR